MEKEVRVFQVANGSEHGHKSLLHFWFKSYETNAQWNQGNWLKVAIWKGQAIGSVSAIFPLCLYACLWWPGPVGNLWPCSCSCSLLTIHLSSWTAVALCQGRGDADIVHFGKGSCPDCDLAPSPFSPTACWEAPTDTTWKAKVFCPQGGTRKPPLCCPPSREWQRTLLCDLIAPFPLVSQSAIHLRSVCTQC